MSLELLTDMTGLTRIVYHICDSLPQKEQYILISQLKRAMISTRLNLREGNASRGDKRLNLFKISWGSLMEVDECILIAKEIYDIDDKEFQESYRKCRNRLKRLIDSILSILSSDSDDSGA